MQDKKMYKGMEIVSWEEAEMIDTPAYPEDIDDQISRELEADEE